MVNYVMESRQNYTPDLVAEIAAGTQATHVSTDQLYPGLRFDHVRRKIIYDFTTSPGSGLSTNTTGFVLWDGNASIAIGASYVSGGFGYANFSTAEKDIDLDTVTFYPAYDQNFVVPVGAGPRATGTVTFGAGNPTNGQTVVLNGVTWTFVTGSPSGTQTQIKGSAALTVQQLAWDLNGSANASLTPARYYADGVTAVLYVKYRTAGTAGNAYTLAAGTTGSTPSAATLAGGATGSDGTWRRATKDFLSQARDSQANPPGLVDPRTGNHWITSASCELYCFRRDDKFAQAISPIYPVYNVSNDVTLVGLTTNWAYAYEADNTSPTKTLLYVIPINFTAAEITADEKLVYATYAYPSARYGDLSNTTYTRHAIDTSANLYAFSALKSGGKAFKLYKFTPPTVAQAPFGGPTTGGAWSDITPWDSTHGPNTNSSAYTLQAQWVTPFAVNTPLHLMYVPAPTNVAGQDALVCLSTNFPTEKTLNSVDPSLWFMDCTYVTTPGGTPAFEFHSAFVTGYMSSTWTTTNAAGAKWAVSDVMETNGYLDLTDYTYAGVDYTKRWFFFLCQPVTAGVVDTDRNNAQIVMVQYQFVPGAAPVLVQFQTEAQWNAANATYLANILANGAYTNVVQASVNNLDRINQGNIDASFWDVGLFDTSTNSFWWGGENTNLFLLSPKVSPDNTSKGVTCPFLYMSFSQSHTYCIPACIGASYVSQGQLLRPVGAQEAGAANGPAQGKTRRTFMCAPLLYAAQGVSFGTDFTDGLHAAEFESEGGTPTPLTSLYSGVWRDRVDDEYGYNSMWCWQVSRPYPCTIVSASCFLHTQDL